MSIQNEVRDMLGDKELSGEKFYQNIAKIASERDLSHRDKSFLRSVISSELSPVTFSRESKAAQPVQRRDANRQQREGLRGAIGEVEQSPRGEVLTDIGGVNLEDVTRSYLNQIMNVARPQVRKVARATPLGSNITSIADFISDIMNNQLPLYGTEEGGIRRQISDLLKAGGRKMAEVAGQPLTQEEQLLQYLGETVPAKPFPERPGLQQYAGIGTFKTPHGTFNIDPSGTVRKL